MSRRLTVRQTLYLSASLGALALSAGTAQAQNGMFVRRPVDPAAQAAAAAQAQASSAANASAIAQRTLDAFARAASARDAATGAQAAARAAAAQSQAALAVPNGLGEGGLKVADGVTFDPSAITGNNDPRLSSANLWTGAEGPTQSEGGGHTTVTVEQTQQKAILSWETFNVGRDTTVYFDQRAGGNSASEWIALNRITDPSGDPSKIFGNIKAEGQVYLINQNGILFGGTSKINVHTLVASSLDIAGDTLAQKNGKFVNGILFNPNENNQGALLTFGERFENYYRDPNPFTPNPVQPEDVSTLPGETFADGDGVTIAAGAEITTANYGRALIMGHNVVNQGTIHSPDGQVILAAGRGIYLARNIAPDAVPFNFSLDPDLRGMLSNVNRGGKVENSGIVTSDRGNVTFNGKTVLQNGFVQATTSASQNGSLIFKAGDSVSIQTYPQTFSYGTLSFGEGSTTQILPDGNDEKAIGFDQFRSSKIDMRGRYITFGEDSTVYAPGARMVVDAQAGPRAPKDFVRDPVTGDFIINPNSEFSFLEKPDDSRLYLASGARIDISGLRGIGVAMDQNTIQGELRANELKDNPVLRNSFLRGRDIYFDARKGTAVADIAGYYDLIERNVGELMTEGGSLQLKGPEIITREGSVIDLSGGSLNYAGGYVRSSLLVDRVGNVVRIEDALAGVDYVGFYGDTIINHDRWGVTETFSSPFFRPEGRYEAGYVEGRSAGSLTIGATSFGDSPAKETDFRIFDGDVVGDVVVGVNQRDKPTGATAEDVSLIWRQRPMGATLTIGVRNVDTGAGDNFDGGNITIGDADALPEDFDPTTQLDRSDAYNYLLPARYFDGNTFGRVSLYSGNTDSDADGVLGGRLTIGEGVTVDLGDFGSFSFDGTRADIDGTIRAAGGSVSISTLKIGNAGFAQTPDWTTLPDGDKPRINLGATARIDVAGRWINDFTTTADRPALAIDGGSVTLRSSHDLIVAAGSVIDVSGGGHLAADGIKIDPGNGGAIVLANNYRVGGVVNAPTGPSEGVFNVAGELRGFALGRGATLTMATSGGVVIGDTPVMTDGVLEADEEAAADFVLAAETLFPVGSFVPIPTSATFTNITTGEPLPIQAFINFDFVNEGFNPIVTLSDWVLPSGLEILGSDFFTSYVGGDTVPAGTSIGFLTGEQPQGTIIPAGVLGDRALPINPVTVVTPAGIAQTDIVVAAGTVIPKGSRLDLAVAYEPLLNLTPDSFSRGGFSSIGVAGANGVTVLEGTRIAPATESFILDSAGRSIETGTALFGVAGRGVLPEALGNPMALAFSASQFDFATGEIRQDNNAKLAPALGRVIIGDGAEIRLTAGSAVDLRSATEVDINGVIDTPGGTIRAGVNALDNGAGLVRLGAQAKLLAQGYVRTVRDGEMDVRQVRAGGNVTLGGQTSGFALPNFVMTDAESVIDVSGIQAVGDFRAVSGSRAGATTGYVSRRVDGAGGSVSIIGGNGVIAGRLDLAPGGETGRGGVLSITNVAGVFGPGTDGIGVPMMRVTQNLTESLAEAARGPIDPDSFGFTVIADRINASGADDLTLVVATGSTALGTGVLRFDGDISLSTRRSIGLNAGVIAGQLDEDGTVDIRSGRVSITPRLGNDSSFQPTVEVPFAEVGVGRFTVTADLIDIADTIDFGCADAICVGQGVGGGFDSVNFISSGDIRLNDGRGQARLRSLGEINFTAAQVASLSGFADGINDFGGFLVESAERVTITSNGKPSQVPLTYGSKLTIRAPEIVQAGVLRAPYGEIVLDAGERVTLRPGSLTSISLEGAVVPAGLRLGGWGTIDNQFDNIITNASVRLDAPSVAVEDGAVVNVSGGGDLLAYQFVPGNGGSRNILAPEGGYFAVSPGIGGAPSPILPSPDRDISIGGLQVGDSIYLDGIAGLPAGVYTLLPPQMALTEGAMLIKPVGDGGLAGSPAAVGRPDGSTIIGGYGLVQGTAIRDAGYRRFEVMPRKVFDQYSQLERYSFNEYISGVNAQAVLDAAGTNAIAVSLRSANDAGTLVLAASETLVLDGEGRFEAGKNGLLGGLDIAADKIAVIGGGSAAPDGFLALDTGKLNAFGAGSLFIGGTRTATANGTALDFVASEVTVANDGNSALVAPEILIGARDLVSFADGAAISAEGAKLGGGSPLVTNGDAALVRASTGGRLGVISTGAAGATGVLDIGESVSLAAAGSLSLTGSANVLIDPAAILDAAQLDLSSNTVNLGDTPDGVTGTILSNATLAKLGGADDLLIRGFQSIDFYGAVKLGEPGGTLGAVTFDTALLRGLAANGETASISATQVTLRNSGDAIEASSPAGAGRLALNADRLILGPGEVAVAGFASFAANAGLLQGQGKGGLTILGDADIAAPLVSAAAGSDYGLRASGDLALVSAPGTAQAIADFGGRLAVSGANVLVDTAVVMPAGIFEATANQNLTLGANARIDMRGVTVDFRDVVRHASGGGVRLNAGGDIAQSAGSTIDVSGDARGGHAGWIAVDAGGQAVLAGTLTGSAKAGFSGGGFSADAGSLADFAALNGLLETGGFTRARAIGVATGDLVLAQGQTITAHDVMLRSDTGAVSIAGAIDANGTIADVDGGSVRLIGGGGVTLAGSARIEARAANVPAGAFSAQSGSVEIAATGGRVNIAQGATVDVSGGKQGGGKVLIRAARDGNDVAIDRLDGTFTGARDMAIAGTETYAADVVDGGLRDTVLADAAAWMQNASAIEARLGNGAFEVRPGIVIESEGDLSIVADINLSPERYGGATGYLDFSSAGDLLVDATISDGFAGVARDSALLAGSSWSYGFASGGDMTLAAGRMIRTGTGDIRMDAGRDLVLTDNQSVIYTAGSKTATAAGFTAPEGLVTGEFPTKGGDISISAGRDILAPITKQAMASWLFRSGQTNWDGGPDTSTVRQQTSWSIIVKNYEQGIGALGGGNIDIAAGRDISQLAVSLPTTGHMTTPVGGIARSEDLVVRGGGDLTLTAGRDLLGGVFMLGEGEGLITAGGALKPSDTLVEQRTVPSDNSPQFEMRTMGALFALMDAGMDIVAREGVLIEGAFDPIAFQGQVCQNVGGNCNSTFGRESAFNSHTERSRITAQSVSGDVIDRFNPWASIDLSRGAGDLESAPASSLTPENDNIRPMSLNFARMPGTVKLTSLRGDIRFAPPFFGYLYALSPTDNGAFEMLAADELNQNTFYANSRRVVMLDKAAPYRRGPLNPYDPTSIQLPPNATTNIERGFVPNHINDPNPVRLYAMAGSNNFTTMAPKPVYLHAGLDVTAGLEIQHNRPDQVSFITAGRSIGGVYPELIEVAGPGSIVLEAGDDIRPAVISAGNYPGRTFNQTANLALPEDDGADIYMLAGTKHPLDYAGFTGAYLDPANGQDVVRTYLPELKTYMAGLGFEGSPDDDLVARFGALPLESRKPFLQQIFFTELQQTGIDVNDPDSPRFQNYDRGYEAIERLFPGDAAALPESERSNILIGGNQIETQAGGDITILAPYGRVEVGSASNVNSNFGGVITRKGGDVRIMADGNIDLFVSRVFSLQGGDVTMWTSNGDITAGAGAKTSVFRPPLVYNISNDGSVSINVFGLQTGAGIGVLDAGGTGEREASRLDLIAPRGEVNAGDAGIRVVGDLNIAALTIVGLDNIDVSGEATGLPEIVAVNVGALTTASAAASAVTKAAEAVARRDPAPVQREIPSIITSRLLGFGEE